MSGGAADSSVHNGRVVKRTGDGSIIEFRSVVDAVRCAIEVQNGTSEDNAGVPPDRRKATVFAVLVLTAPWPVTAQALVINAVVSLGRLQQA